jgi:sigma-B regulation protein RsbU (phosphoserine phosphatase)
MWIGWGVALAVIPNLLFGDIPVLLGRGSQMPDALGSLLLLIIPVVTAIAVLRYRLWDIDLFIRTSLVYSTLTLALGAVYFLLTFFFIRIVGSTSIDGTDRSLGSVHFIAALIVVFLFAPTYQYFKRLIDRLFYRNQIDYSQVLADLSRKLSTSLLLEDVMWLLREIIPQRLQLQGATVLLNTAPPVGSAEYQRLRAGHVVVLQHLDGQPIPRPYPLDKLQLEGMWACAPLLSGDKLLGLYGIGKKKSGKYYNDKEIELIETLARQAGIALQNTQLHLELAEQVRFERDLELSRQIQESLLPAYDPVVPQLDIVGFSLPAQLVGGDFYHYFEFGADRIGIAVGDVSGKGLPAALLMAVSISTVRAHDADAAHNTAELLAKMNNLLQVQMRISKVNVAMLYAIIEHDTADRLRFRVSNAGLISPNLLRPGQPCEFLDACGLPMGIVDDPLYYECAFQLCRGDLIILGSDGIVEAMNHQREMYGFERLEALINSLPDDICAGDFIKQLQASVETFVGVAPQHDDMTVVAIRVK